MCGIAEATLAMSIISSVAGVAESQIQARETSNAQQRMDTAAYQNYLVNHRQLEKRADQIRQTSAQKSMAQAQELAEVKGRSRVYFGESGLGGYALTGNTVDSYFNDIVLQASTGRARLQQETTDNLDNVLLSQEAAYSQYRVRYAQHVLPPMDTWSDALFGIAEAGVGYMNNDQRNFLKNDKASGKSFMNSFGVS